MISYNKCDIIKEKQKRGDCIIESLISVRKSSLKFLVERALLYEYSFYAAYIKNAEEYEKFYAEICTTLDIDKAVKAIKAIEKRKNHNADKA